MAVLLRCEGAGEGECERPNAEAKGANMSERDGMISFAERPDMKEAKEEEEERKRRKREEKEEVGGGSGSKKRRGFGC